MHAMPGAADPMVSTGHAGGCGQALRVFLIGTGAPDAMGTCAAASKPFGSIDPVCAYSAYSQACANPDRAGTPIRALISIKPCIISIRSPSSGVSVPVWGRPCTDSDGFTEIPENGPPRRLEFPNQFCSDIRSLGAQWCPYIPPTWPIPEIVKF